MSTIQANIPIEELKQVLTYNPESGVLRWAVDRGKMKKGSLAGSIKYKKGKPAYLKMSYKGCTGYIHRIVWAINYGSWPDDQIDHIDGDGFNNRLSNLRSADNLINSYNKRLIDRNTSGVMGVHKDRETGKWRSDIGSNQSNSKLPRQRLGRFDDWFDAVCARKSAEARLGIVHENHGRR